MIGVRRVRTLRLLVLGVVLGVLAVALPDSTPPILAITSPRRTPFL